MNTTFATPSRDTLAIEMLRAVCAGVDVRRNGRILRMEGTHYCMWTAGDRCMSTGKAFEPAHKLAVVCTDPQRLLAHWEGFSGGPLTQV